LKARSHQKSYLYTRMESATIWRGWHAKSVGLHIQIPFCKGICKYCPFNKVLWQREMVSRYLEALKKEIAAYAKLVPGAVIPGIYMGGGTPTSLTGNQLAELILHCRESLEIAPDADIAVEANPNTVDERKLRTLLDLGVDRISLGVQSFSGHFLKVIGRAQKANTSVRAIKLAQEVGFSRLNIDLLYNLPGQCLSDWEKELHTAVELKVPEISVYPLIPFRYTQLYDELKTAKIPSQADRETNEQMYVMAMEFLGRAGYYHERLYTYARPEQKKSFVSVEAFFPEYIGVGAGAFSMINHHQYCNIHPLDAYISAVNRGHLPIAVGRKFTPTEEIMRWFSLRMTGELGVDKVSFRARFGQDMEKVDALRGMVRQMELEHLIECQNSLLKLTLKGMHYYDRMARQHVNWIGKLAEECMRTPQPTRIEVPAFHH
jgi:oxygen-independent coproporphyrinogen-3 oxidase